MMYFNFCLYSFIVNTLFHANELLLLTAQDRDIIHLLQTSIGNYVGYMLYRMNDDE